MLLKRNTFILQYQRKKKEHEWNVWLAQYSTSNRALCLRKCVRTCKHIWYFLHILPYPPTMYNWDTCFCASCSVINFQQTSTPSVPCADVNVGLCSILWKKCSIAQVHAAWRTMSVCFFWTWLQQISFGALQLVHWRDSEKSSPVKPLQPLTVLQSLPCVLSVIYFFLGWRKYFVIPHMRSLFVL